MTETATAIDSRPESKAAPAPLVDTHAHIYHDDMPMAETAWHRPPRSAPLEEFLATLDGAGVRHAVLAAASIYGDYNDYMLEAVRAHRRLRTTVIVKPDIGLAALRAMAEAGVVGIRLQYRSTPNPPDLNDPEQQRLLKQIADLGWHVHLHDVGDRLARYIPAIEKAGPDLVIDHFGRPPGPDPVASAGFRAVLDAVGRGRTWVKLSAAYRLDAPDSARALSDRLLAEAGPQRLFWGSDWPFAAFEDTMTYAGAIAQFHDYVPDAATRSAMDSTAMAFYFK